MATNTHSLISPLLPITARCYHCTIKIKLNPLNKT